MYEDPAVLAEYLLFHYGSGAEILPWDFGPKAALNFPVRTAAAADPFLRRCAACEGIAATPAPTRALDLGCAVGRSSFELARRFTAVLGLDFSRQFIAAATRLAAGEAIPYARKDEGDLTAPLLARPPHGFPGAAAPPEPPPEESGHTSGPGSPSPSAPASPRSLARAPHFAVADACQLPDRISDHPLTNFDLVHAANLLCRLPDPAALLRRLPALVKPGGLLILATPATWLEEFTPKPDWLGGFHDPATGRPRRTLDGLRLSLDPHFQFLEVRDEPFLIREHARKFQWSVAQVTVWERGP